MPTKTILFLMAFVFACGGALFVPLIGVIGYVLDYHLSPATQWWGQAISHWGLRFSLILGVATGVGTILAHGKLRYGPKLISRHEWVILLFLGWVWILSLLHPVDVSLFEGVDIPALKLTKIVIFAMILTHVVTSAKSLDWLLWAIVVGAVFLGYQAYTAPRWMFTRGQLESIGGPDFRQSNGLAAYLAACLPIVGIQFLRSGWKGKMICAVAGVLAVNTIVLTRSRGALVGLAGGAIVALVTAPKRSRKAILAGLIVVAIGAWSLTDPGFWRRAETITAEEGQRDFAAQSRIDIWVASLDMLKEHPEGIGAGNFQARIGDFTEEHPERDAHNTFVLCWSELGIPGLVLFALLIVNAFRTLIHARKRSSMMLEDSAAKLYLVSYGLLVGLTVFLGCGLTTSRLYTEGIWWFLVMPLCLSRALENLRADTLTIPATRSHDEERSTQAAKVIAKSGTAHALPEEAR